MADLNARIKPKKSSTAGEVPLAADLEVSEIAVNTADGKLFVKHTDDTIKEISGSGGGGASTLEDLTDVYVSGPTPGQVLTYSDDSTSALILAHFNADGEGDSSNNAIATTWESNARFTTTSKFGAGAYRSVGSQSNNAVIFADNPGYNMGSSDFCMEAWLYIDENALPSNGTVPLICRRGADGFANNESSFCFQVTFDTLRARFIFGHGATNDVFDTPLDPFSVLSWHHFAVSRDGDTLRVFVDGVLKGTHDVTGMSMYSSSRTVAVGQYADGQSFTTRNFECFIDEVRLVAGKPVYTDTFALPTSEYAAVEGVSGGWIAANSSGPTRTTASVTTSSLASAASEDVTLTGTGKAGQFLSVTTDRPAWIVFYADEASRTSDSSRLETDSPSPGSGVLMEIITTAGETIIVSPSVSYFNNEASPVASLPLKVTNKDASTQAVQVDVSLIPSES